MQQFNQNPNQWPFPQIYQLPQQPNNQNAPFMYQQIPTQVQTGLQILERIQGIYVEKKLNAVELITGGVCEQQNIYYVYSMGQNGDIQLNEPLFKIKEISNFCLRQILPGDMRPFNLQMTDIVTNQVLLQGKRDCKCTCLCFNRPQLNVLDNLGNLRGVILDPFTCCTLQTPVFDQNNVLKYKIKGDACTCAFFCRFALPCKDCQQFSFQVTDGNDINLTTIERTFSGCTCQEYYNRLSTRFPMNANFNDKLLLIFTLVFLDFKYFEEGKRTENSELHQ